MLGAADGGHGVSGGAGLFFYFFVGQGASGEELEEEAGGVFEAGSGVGRLGWVKLGLCQPMMRLS